jgi:hypothetical protein
MKRTLITILSVAYLNPTPLVAEAAIPSREMDRVEVILQHDEELLSEALDTLKELQVENTQLTAQTDEFLGYLEKLEEIKADLTTIPANQESDEIIGGVPVDFEKFKAGLPKTEMYEQPDGTPSFTMEEGYEKVTYYIVEQDLPLTELELLFFHEQSLQLAGGGDSGGSQDAFADSFTSADPRISPDNQSPLKAATEGGRVVRWIPGSTLKYCILKWTFNGDDDRYRELKKRMDDACQDWEKECNIKFQHIENLDGLGKGKVFPKNPDGSRQVLFVLAQKPGVNAIARAFFPHDHKNKRMLLIDEEQYFASPIDKTGVLRHELGHILGFRHEHISANQKAWHSDFCNGETVQGSKPVTAYDRASVMHYPCKRLLTEGPLPANLELELTDFDKSGARSIYGGPGGGEPTGNLSFRDFDPYK